MSYFKIQQNKPLITSESPIVERYFSVLDNEHKSKVANNGWIMNARPDVDFGSEVNFDYLRRNINIWSDNIKLRYGKCPADSPYLWAHVTEYVT